MLNTTLRLGADVSIREMCSADTPARTAATDIALAIRNMVIKDINMYYCPIMRTHIGIRTCMITINNMLLDKMAEKYGIPDFLRE